MTHFSRLEEHYVALALRNKEHDRQRKEEQEAERRRQDQRRRQRQRRRARPHSALAARTVKPRSTHAAHTKALRSLARGRAAQHATTDFAAALRSPDPPPPSRAPLAPRSMCQSNHKRQLRRDQLERDIEGLVATMKSHALQLAVLGDATPGPRIE